MVDPWDQVPAPTRRHFLKTGVSALAAAPLWLGRVGDPSLALASGPAAQGPPEKYFEAAFGVTEDAAPNAPANFNLLLRDAGRLAILDADSGELLGRLDVRRPDKRSGRPQK